jgi:ligand-binding sensor domain-containing protein
MKRNYLFVLILGAFCFAFIWAQQIDSHIRSIFQDSKGTYWFGTNSAGVFRLSGQELTQFTVKNGLAANQVLTIQEDADGNIWFSSGDFRISKFDGQNWSALTQKVKISKDCAARPNDLWFGAGGGAWRYRNNALTYLPFEVKKKAKQNPFLLSRFGVYAVLKDTKGTLWFGTQAEGVCCQKGSQTTWFKEKGLAAAAVLCLFEDHAGNLWFGNNGSGVFRYDGKSLTNFTDENKLGNPDFKTNGKPGPGTLARIYAINEDQQGQLWFGTVDAGVWKYDGSKFTNYTVKDGLTSNAVNTIYKDKNGELWFGTDSHGICKFNGQRFTAFKIGQ